MLFSQSGSLRKRVDANATALRIASLVRSVAWSARTRPVVVWAAEERGTTGIPVVGVNWRCFIAAGSGFVTVAIARGDSRSGGARGAEYGRS
jgi:hypothetical protein